MDLLTHRNLKFEHLLHSEIDEEYSPLDSISFIERDDIVVLDGYQFDFKFQQRIKLKYGCKVVAIDDTVSNPFAADMVINHIGGLEASQFQIPEKSKLLLGPKYAILQQVFFTTSSKGNSLLKGERPSLLINFGGSDPTNQTCETLTHVLKTAIDFHQVHVVVGSMFLFLENLSILTDRTKNIIVHRGIESSNMAQLMAECEVAILSASTVAYEYCSVSGLLFLIQTAANQIKLYKYLVSSNLGLPFSEFENRDNYSTKTGQLKVAQKTLFDNKSAKRLENEFLKLFLLNNYGFRRATPEDVELYYSWVNDDQVRNNSFSTSIVSYSEHCHWFYTNLKSEQSLMYLITTRANVAVASVRFLKKENEAFLSYLIDSKFRGLGLSKHIVKEGVSLFFREELKIDKIVALVKPENVPSIKAFLANEFLESTDQEESYRKFLKYRTHEQSI